MENLCTQKMEKKNKFAINKTETMFLKNTTGVVWSVILKKKFSLHQKTKIIMPGKNIPIVYSRERY